MNTNFLIPVLERRVIGEIPIIKMVQIIRKGNSIIITFDSKIKNEKVQMPTDVLKYYFYTKCVQEMIIHISYEDNSSLIKLINLRPLQLGSNEKFLCQQSFWQKHMGGKKRHSSKKE